MKKLLFTAWLVLALFAGGLHAQNKDSLTLVNAKWDIKQLADGVEWRSYQFSGDEKLFGANEIINVVVVDQQNPKNRFALATHEGKRMKTSDLAKNKGAVVAINATFFETKPPYGPESYLRVDGKELSGPAGWAVFALIDQNGRLSMEYSLPKQQTEPTMFHSWPLLVEKGKTQPLDGKSRDPRTAVGTAGNKVFMVTVDGRRDKYSAGLAMEELALVMKWLGAENAMNLDGGGSTTMYISGQPDNGVVNYPSDSFFGFNHRGERSVATSLLLLHDQAATASK